MFWDRKKQMHPPMERKSISKESGKGGVIWRLTPGSSSRTIGKIPSITRG